MINTVTIIGAGQVGTSIALALAQAAPHIRVTMHDINQSTPDLVKERFDGLKISHDFVCFATSAKDAAAASELVILATPLSAMGPIVSEIKDSLGVGTILTDTGSAKGQAIAEITAALGDTYVPYVPAHPGNGSQGSGPLTGKPDSILGGNSWMFLIEEKGHHAATSPAHGLVREFWESAGVQVAVTDATTHDKFFGTCSHFEHFAAFAFLNLGRDDPARLETYAAGGTGFRNFTRVAISAMQDNQASALVAMWRPIFEQNRDKILESAENFKQHFAQMMTLVARKDRTGLVSLLTEARDFRQSVKDSEPRENILGELVDTGAVLEGTRAQFNARALTNLHTNLLLPLAISCAQTLNARDVDPELVVGKANPSFRDGTALSLNDPEYVADLLLAHQDAFITEAVCYKFELQDSIEALASGNWDQVEADILSAQTIRNPLPGPRKGKDVRSDYMMLTVA